MVISKKGRRDNAYREIERQRQVSARKLRRAVDRLENANDAFLSEKRAA
jgi:hypothetical protein